MNLAQECVHNNTSLGNYHFTLSRHNFTPSSFTECLKMRQIASSRNERPGRALVPWLNCPQLTFSRLPHWPSGAAIQE